jgi:Tfp pilus assembly protein PilO
MSRKTRERVLVLGVALLAGALVLLLAHQHLSSARAQYTSAKNAYTATARNARNYVSQAGAEGAVLPKPPDRAAITAQIQQVLQKAGLSGDAIRNTSPSPPRQVPGTNFRREEYRVGLTGLSINEIAKFVQAWSHESPVWTISEITVRRQRESFEATLVLECLYVQEESGPTRPGG